MKTSAISPVASFVFTRLSPSEPPGRVSSLTVMLGLAAWKASITAFALATSVSEDPWRNVISVAPALPSPLLLPRLPALQPANSSTPAVPAAISATPRLAVLVNFMEPPELWISEKAGYQQALSEAFQAER